MEVEEPELPEALAMRNSVDVVGDLNGLLSNFQVPLSISAIDFNNLESQLTEIADDDSRPEQPPS
jgi:phage FluMu protein gp41